MAKATKSKIVIATKRNLENLRALDPSIIIEAFKLTKKNGAPPMNGYMRPRLRYVIGKTVIERYYDTNSNINCGAGLNVSTRSWIRENLDWLGTPGDNRIIAVRFTSADIVAIPNGNNRGKFRVKRLTVHRLAV